MRFPVVLPVGVIAMAASEDPYDKFGRTAHIAARNVMDVAAEQARDEGEMEIFALYSSLTDWHSKKADEKMTTKGGKSKGGAGSGKGYAQSSSGSGDGNGGKGGKAHEDYVAAVQDMLQYFNNLDEDEIDACVRSPRSCCNHRLLRVVMQEIRYVKQKYHKKTMEEAREAVSTRDRSRSR